MLGTLYVLAPSGWLEHGDSEQGLELLEGLVKAYPDTLENRLRLAEAYISLGDPGPATPYLCRCQAHKAELRRDDQLLLEHLFADAGNPQCPQEAAVPKPPRPARACAGARASAPRLRRRQLPGPQRPDDQALPEGAAPGSLAACATPTLGSWLRPPSSSPPRSPWLAAPRRSPADGDTGGAGGAGTGATATGGQGEGGGIQLGDGGMDPVVSITITPANPTIEVLNGVIPAATNFVATGKTKGGAMVPMTGSWSYTRIDVANLNPSSGAFTPTGLVGGQGTVSFSAGGLERHHRRHGQAPLHERPADGRRRPPRRCSAWPRWPTRP